MDIHLSIGVSTIVALMKVHRVTEGRPAPPPEDCDLDADNTNDPNTGSRRREAGESAA